MNKLLFIMILGNFHVADAKASYAQYIGVSLNESVNHFY